VLLIEVLSNWKTEKTYFEWTL